MGKITVTRSSGFTLIELLVVVAIIGILAAVGVVAYSGYVDSAKKKSAENIMQQIALAQTEHYSDYSVYYENSGCSNISATTSRSIEKNLLGGDGINPTIITEDVGFNMCTEANGASFNVIASDDNVPPECKITLNGNDLGITRGSGC
tara:strand:+ start:469 stop:912 length:444 start_codon:yes stop_codon:yes gene_type:complete